ncbi:MAG TPA: transcriptional regulator [Lachnospiraceae bacterium]|nr:transcriptional regulator [Lachnospiraceae bacterium]
MVFSSLLFLFWFMPLFFAVYYITPKRAKNAVLFAGSIVFYGWGEPKYLILILVSVLFNYLAGLLINALYGRTALRRAVFSLSVAFNTGVLFFFKYINFFIININRLAGTSITQADVTLPLGISFYTFQIMSYIIDLYRERVAVERSFLRLGTYIVMFPQLIAGPIVVYSEVNEGLLGRRITPGDAEEGLKLFVVGLASKVMIANNVGRLWNEIGEIGFSNISTALAWLGAIAFTLQIYFDFNGYSLMAVGLGRMLGFCFPRNFNYPYISGSVTEFWRRWHITLSSWFRDYLYIPLGGNRRGRLRTYVNLFIVWFVTGFWHGADWNFILWGIYFFILILLERIFLLRFLEKHGIFSHVYTMLAVIVSWVIFAVTDLKELGVYLGRMFLPRTGSDALYYLGNYGFIILLGCVLSTPAAKGLYGRVKDGLCGTVISAVLFFLCVAYLADASFNPFLYFRF